MVGKSSLIESECELLRILIVSWCDILDCFRRNGVRACLGARSCPRPDSGGGLNVPLLGGGPWFELVVLHDLASCVRRGRLEILGAESFRAEAVCGIRLGCALGCELEDAIK